MKNWLMICCILCCSHSLLANDTTSSNRLQLLREIAALQSVASDSFPDGAFPSFRKYHFSKKMKADYNLFYTALVIYNIEKYRAHLSAEELTILNQMRQKAAPYFSSFKNTKNNLTYNFWPKNPPVIFPNGGWLNHFNEQGALPDDIDDCAIVMLALANQDSAVVALNHKMLEYRNGYGKTSKGFYKKYKNEPVYTTWMGNIMPRDIDISVISNVLLMNSVYHIPMQSIDSVSLNMIIELIQEKKHVKDARYVSQHYANTSTILYHLARLMRYSTYAPLQKLKPVLVDQAKTAYKSSKYTLEQLLLQNTLLQLGDTSFSNELISRDALRTNDFPYFIANLSCLVSNPFKRPFAASSLGKFTYYSYAFNLSLLFEHAVLSNY